MPRWKKSIFDKKMEDPKFKAIYEEVSVNPREILELHCLDGICDKHDIDAVLEELAKWVRSHIREWDKDDAIEIMAYNSAIESIAKSMEEA